VTERERERERGEKEKEIVKKKIEQNEKENGIVNVSFSLV